MNLDVLTLGSGFVSFGIFLLIHIITFRWVRPEHLLRSLLLCVIAMLLCPLVIISIFYNFKVIDAPLQAWVAAAFFAMLIQGLLCFVYVLCIFGPFETSVRMRLLREISQGASKGITLNQLLERYNSETIVKIRLQRLLGSGDLIERSGFYRAGHKQNFFFIFDAIAGVLKKWINRRQS